MHEQHDQWNAQRDSVQAYTVDHRRQDNSSTPRSGGESEKAGGIITGRKLFVVRACE